MLGAPPNEVTDPLHRPRSQLAESRPNTGRLEELVGHFLVMARDRVGLQLFHRMREGVVADVVQQGRQFDLGDRPSRQVVEPVQLALSIQGLDRAACEVVDAERVQEAIVYGARIDEMGKAELLHPAEALEFGGVHHRCGGSVQVHVLPQWVPYGPAGGVRHESPPEDMASRRPMPGGVREDGQSLRPPANGGAESPSGRKRRQTLTGSALPAFTATTSASWPRCAASTTLIATRFVMSSTVAPR